MQDFEQNEIDRKRERELKRKRQDQFGFEDDEDVSDDDSDRKQASAKRQKAKDIDSANAMKPADVAKFEGQSATAVIQQLKNSSQKDKGKGGMAATKKREMKAL